MRYVLAMLLVMGIGVTAAMPAAFADGNADPATYQNGIAVSSTAPAPVSVAPASTSDSGSLAGPAQSGQGWPFQQIRIDDGNNGGQ
jgi:hypothetical protein